ncbi:hypothetical protein IE81DRAFT_319828 [Ceraceosorus guamensis]|uniref:DUF3074 domain-containing protein n=1 Tax=Ceraceosorus guamensis TaxID=1522189 RepID=A0A316WBA7_9BASI|nr:hypothetical protein IE81DRAFT_319828 [Ceraceosorus guamensis]PWN45971.1 hypothetical protein IE81DRAFT_319828 [Ceraceosorus guamensis]
MTTPSSDAAYPFEAAPVPISTLTDETGSISQDAISAYVKQAFAMIRASHGWAKGKVIKTEVAPVQSFKGNSVHKGRLAKCGWHGRHSVHPPSEAKGLTWDDFKAGLLIDHPQQETEYISEMTAANQIDELKKGVAEVWNNTYNLPSLTSNRDFLELLITLELPPHPTPYSEAHEALVLQQLRGESLPASEPQSLRSFIVIQQPVSHDKCPHRSSEGYVRAYYASVEAISETQAGETDWRMFLQSDASGRIPLMFQEMAMPSKTAPDVPCFINWKSSKKATGKEEAQKSVPAVAEPTGAETQGAASTAPIDSQHATGSSAAADASAPAPAAGVDAKTTTTDEPAVA